MTEEQRRNEQRERDFQIYTGGANTTKPKGNAAHIRTRTEHPKRSNLGHGTARRPRSEIPAAAPANSGWGAGAASRWDSGDGGGDLVIATSAGGHVRVAAEVDAEAVSDEEIDESLDGSADESATGTPNVASEHGSDGYSDESFDSMDAEVTATNTAAKRAAEAAIPQLSVPQAESDLRSMATDARPSSRVIRPSSSHSTARRSVTLTQTSSRRSNRSGLSTRTSEADLNDVLAAIEAENEAVRTGRYTSRSAARAQSSASSRVGSPAPTPQHRPPLASPVPRASTSSFRDIPTGRTATDDAPATAPSSNISGNDGSGALSTAEQNTFQEAIKQERARRRKAAMEASASQGSLASTGPVAAEEAAAAAAVAAAAAASIPQSRQTAPQPTPTPSSPPRSAPSSARKAKTAGGLVNASQETMGLLVDQLQLLDKRKQGFLLQLLMQLNTETEASNRQSIMDQMSASIGDPAIWKQLKAGITQSVAVDTADGEGDGPQDSAPSSSPALAAPSNAAKTEASDAGGAETTPTTSVTLRCLSTWAPESKAVGLTALQMYGRKLAASDDGTTPGAAQQVQQVDLGSCKIALTGPCAPGPGLGASSSVYNLVGGPVRSTNGRHMWMNSLTTPLGGNTGGNDAKYIDVEFTVVGQWDVTRLVIWNYNRATLTSVVGVKDAEVRVNGVTKWKGVLRRASGSKDVDDATSLDLTAPESSPSDRVDPKTTTQSTPKPTASTENTDSVEETGDEDRPSWLGSATPRKSDAEAASPLAVSTAHSAATRASGTERFGRRSTAEPVKATQPLEDQTVPAPLPDLTATGPKFGRRNRQPQRDPEQIKQSWDSLAFFERTQKGRLPLARTTQAIPEAEVPTATSGASSQVDPMASTAPSRAKQIIPGPPVAGQPLQSATTFASAAGNKPHVAPAPAPAASAVSSLTQPTLPAQAHAPAQTPAPAGDFYVPTLLQRMSDANSAVAEAATTGQRRISTAFDGASATGEYTPVAAESEEPDHSVLVDDGDMGNVETPGGSTTSSMSFDASLAPVPLSTAPQAGSSATAAPDSDAVPSSPNLSAMLDDLEIEAGHLLDKSIAKKQGSLPSAGTPVAGGVRAGGTGLFNTSMDGSLEASMDADLEASASMVDIPELPTGRCLRISLLSTWGDPHYVGLAGLDMFDGFGNEILLEDIANQVTADPEDINVLPEYGNDPRVVANLFDGTNHTSDDLHVWLAPWPGKDRPARITIDFKRSQTLSMIRVWNYNKNRIHSYRGAKLIRLELDDHIVFEGEVKQAPGQVGGDVGSVESCSEVILFTEDQSILASIEEHDPALAEALKDPTTEFVTQTLHNLEADRPSTADRSRAPRTSRPNSRVMRRRGKAPQEFVPFESLGAVPTERPTTAAVIPKSKARPPLVPMTPLAAESSEYGSTSGSVLGDDGSGEGHTISDLVQQAARKAPSVAAGLTEGAVLTDMALSDVPFVRAIRLRLLSTCGDPHYAGLTALEVYTAEAVASASGQSGISVQRFPLTVKHLRAKPKDINSDGYSGDPRTLDKLVDGTSLTMNDLHMWLIPYTPGGSHTLAIDLGESHRVVGIKVWNYNKSLDDTARGFGSVQISLDGQPLQQSAVVLRPAPGSVWFDFGQSLFFQNTSSGVALRCGYLDAYGAEQHAVTASMTRGGLPRYITPSVRQDYEPPLLPGGCIFRFVFRSTWGDPYYLGLDGLALYDAEGRVIRLHPSQIHALPMSINDLYDAESLEDGNQLDPRLPSNLALPPLDAADQPLTSYTRPGDYTPWSSSRAWLAPLAHSLDPGMENELVLTFDHPVTISMIRVWNYSKNPARGVSDVELWLDGTLVYSGGLQRSNAQSNAGPGPGIASPSSGGSADFPGDSQVMIFTNDPKIIKQERKRTTYCGTADQHVTCINEGRVMELPQGVPRNDPTAAGVFSDPQARPTTMMVGRKA